MDRPDNWSLIDDVVLYPDALPCLQAARESGLVVGIAGNQPTGAETQLRGAGFAADAGAILYVGDRLDSDILPARDAGMKTAFIRRGPWGYIHAQSPDAELADVRLDSLTELAAVWT